MPDPDLHDHTPTSASSAPEPTLQRVLVLGLGNDILCDDAIGLRVVREVQRQLASDEAIDVQETEEMGLCLLDYISGYRDLVLVDSIQRGTIPAGAAHEIQADDVRTLPGSSPHFLGVGETLALGRELGLPMPERVRIVAIEVQEPHLLSTEMTPALQRALPGLVQRVLAIARELADMGQS